MLSRSKKKKTHKLDEWYPAVRGQKPHTVGGPQSAIQSRKAERIFSSEDLKE
jgi:hypothetical protein